jgi:probable rRNA maturation factor
MKIALQNTSGERIPKKFLFKWVQRLERQLKRRLVTREFLGKELGLIFVDEREMARLNLQYRKKKGTTDILSFEPLEEGSLGELVICPQVIRRQALEHGLLLREELGYMVIHGVLHLLGYDHEKNAKQAKIMFDLQDSIFSDLL